MSWFTPSSEAHVKKEKEKARALRKTPWWDQQLSLQRCHYCENSFKKRELTMDHKVPIIRGGRSSKSNLVVSCKNCNSVKSHKTDVEFLASQKK